MTLIEKIAFAEMMIATFEDAGHSAAAVGLRKLVSEYEDQLWSTLPEIVAEAQAREQASQ